jgi:hypothetical protein
MWPTTVFHEDVFYAYFHPFRHPSSQFNIWGGHGLESFGADLQIVKHFDSNRVWTVIDGDKSCDQWITPGMRYVNRVCYLLTKIPHDWAPIEFHTEGRPRPISPAGLARRITTLRRIMHTNQATSVGAQTAAP